MRTLSVVIPFMLFLMFLVVSTAFGDERPEQKCPFINDPYMKNLYPCPDAKSKDDFFTDNVKVTSVMGNLIVSDRTFDEIIEADSGIMPWSSYWFPINETQLFVGPDGKESPLEKYDRFVESAYGLANPESALFEKKIHETRKTLSEADGVCNGWAFASILTPEPKFDVRVTIPKTEEKIELSVFDQKALLVKSHEVVEGVTRYGKRYDNCEECRVHMDIYPEQFQRLVYDQLFLKKLPFVMDHDPNQEVWYVPVYKAQFKMELVKKGDDKELKELDFDMLKVQAWIYTGEKYTSAQDRGNYAEALPPVTRIYTYLLKVKKVEAKNVSKVMLDLNKSIKTSKKVDSEVFYEVIQGAWTEKSKADHPDFVVIPPDRKGKISRKSYNKSLNPRIVDAFLKLGKKI